MTNIAPDADLYLGTFDRPESFERAVAWCVARSVDLVLAPVAAHGVVPGARSLVTEAVRTATRAEIPVVAPTGNAALGHWTRPVARSSLRETGRLDRRIQISPLADGDQAGSRFVGWLTHDGPPELSLRLALYERTDRGTRNLLALSEAVGGGRGDRLVARLTGGDNWLEILIPSGLASDFGRPGIRVEVTTPTHRLAPAHPAGSVAFPAAMPAVIAVGALDVDARDGGTGAAPYSGRGPTADGQTGVDVVARPAPWDGPRGAGTSAAAARTAGIVALAAQYLTTTPARVARVLRETASDVGRKGRDSATGYGRIDADAVVQRARARSREEGKSGSG
ncbi:MAG: S8 family serine peptidase [Haloferacaceae archaeon]